jgi:hypothetical protein
MKKQTDHVFGLLNLKTKYLLPSSRRKTARHLPQRGRQIKAPPSGELSALLTEGVCLHSGALRQNLNAFFYRGLSVMTKIKHYE